MSEQLRLDKYLANMGLGTRSEVKQWIRKGRVKVNDKVCKSAEVKINAEQDEVSFDDSMINYQKYLYYMLNKPAGVVSATRDTVCKTVLDLIEDKKGKELFPVGRLDKDTEGLLLITNDGPLAHSLLSPRKHVDKEYFVRIQGEISKEDRKQLEAGVIIEEGYTTLPAKVTMLQQGDISEILLTIQEGKYHQVKRMIAAVGKEVIYLKRMSMGGLTLDPDLTLGEYRSLTQDEVAYLKSLASKEDKALD